MCDPDCGGGLVGMDGGLSGWEGEGNLQGRSCMSSNLLT